MKRGLFFYLSERLSNLIPQKRDSSRGQWLACGTSLVTLAGVAATSGLAYQHYRQTNLSQIPLETEAVKNQAYTSEVIRFERVQGDRYDIAFSLQQGEEQTELKLKDIDLSLMIPTVPSWARDNDDLVRWFLSEREFNRQRVNFAPGSSHIEVANNVLKDYRQDQLSVSITNNCLGAGHWELAVSVTDADGQSQKIYQGYFDFPKGAYADLVAQYNPTLYRTQARTMEAWPGFRFLSGLPFDLAALRQVVAERPVVATDLATEPVLMAKEQADKAKLIVASASEVAPETASTVTWADLRKSNVAFQSFVPPGIYLPSRVWGSDYSQIANLTGAKAHTITSPAANNSGSETLTELELTFENEAGKARRWIVSGVNIESLPQLAPQNYSDGFYRPLGFGPTFTQDYESLKQLPPDEDPFFSVILDEASKVMNYRQDIGLNGLVMHRDLADPNMLHLYPMSYERITLVGHYVIDFRDRQHTASEPSI